MTGLESDKKYDFSELVCSSVRIFFSESVTQEARQILARSSSQGPFDEGPGDSAVDWADFERFQFLM